MDPASRPSIDPGRPDIDLDRIDLDRIDLDRIERELADVETALERLDDGTYWNDEISGEPIPDELLATQPLTRRVEGPSAS